MPKLRHNAARRLTAKIAAAEARARLADVQGRDQDAKRIWQEVEALWALYRPLLKVTS
jgi:t-SNARE complex subunit (syntaxin)